MWVCDESEAFSYFHTTWKYSRVVRVLHAGLTKVRLLKHQLGEIGCTLDTMSWDSRTLAFGTHAVPSEGTRVLIEDYDTATALPLPAT